MQESENANNVHNSKPLEFLDNFAANLWPVAGKLDRRSEEIVNKAQIKEYSPRQVTIRDRVPHESSNSVSSHIYN